MTKQKAVFIGQLMWTGHTKGSFGGQKEYGSKWSLLFAKLSQEAASCNGGNRKGQQWVALKQFRLISLVSGQCQWIRVIQYKSLIQLTAEACWGPQWKEGLFDYVRVLMQADEEMLSFWLKSWERHCGKREWYTDHYASYRQKLHHIYCHFQAAYPSQESIAERMNIQINSTEQQSSLL